MEANYAGKQQAVTSSRHLSATDKFRELDHVTRVPTT